MWAWRWSLYVVHFEVYCSSVRSGGIESQKRKTFRLSSGHNLWRQRLRRSFLSSLTHHQDGKHPRYPNSLYHLIYLPPREFLKKRGQNTPRAQIMFPYYLSSICLYLAVIHLKTDYHLFVASASVFNTLAVLPPCLRSSSTYTGGKPISTFFCAMSSGVRCL